MSVRVPKYRLHKASGQALVEINGKRIYLGKHGSEASEQKYRRIVAELLSKNGDESSIVGDAATHHEITVNGMILAYWRYAETYYVTDGEPSKELPAILYSLIPLRELYGHTPAKDFGPKALKLIRDHMIEGDLSRRLINSRIDPVPKFVPG